MLDFSCSVISVSMIVGTGITKIRKLGSLTHDTISFQAKAIVELLKRFKWNYVSFVHSDSEYGSTGYEMVKSVVKEGNENVCLADPITIYNNQFDDEDYKRVVETLIGKKNRTKSNNNEKSLLRPRVVIGRYISYLIVVFFL